MQKYKNIAFSYVPKVIYRVFSRLWKQFANKPEQNLNLTQSATFPPFPTAHANAAFPTYGCADA